MEIWRRKHGARMISSREQQLEQENADLRAANEATNAAMDNMAARFAELSARLRFTQATLEMERRKHTVELRRAKLAETRLELAKLELRVERERHSPSVGPSDVQSITTVTTPIVTCCSQMPADGE